ncbi:MAG TPA: tRNA (guanosine(37)-N1)-methyltransferase TrmD [Acidisarcina sp.]
MRFDIVTIFPGLFAGFFDHGVVKRAVSSGLLDVHTVDLRDFTHDRHRTIDDRPFGGGEGMVLKPEPVADAIDSLGIEPKPHRDPCVATVILLSAQGRPFTQGLARELSTLARIVLICGRYEGVDERVNELLADRELSIGDYVLSGGELAAAVVVDATMRLIPGVLGNAASTQFESFGLADLPLPECEAGAVTNQTPPRSTHGAGGLLDYPHYTRPAEFRGLTVPDVLAKGNHEQIRRWRRQKALEKTLRNRPDLLASANLTAEDLAYLQSLRDRGELPASG